MTDSDDISGISRYFRRILPSEINIDKEDIFYRDKYNEIINYIKVLLTDSENLEIINYLKPKGTLLININLGTDIIDYIKLISSNYYLEYFELNNAEIRNSPEEFFNNFNDILKNFVNIREDTDVSEKDLQTPKDDREANELEIPKIEESNKKKLILINQQHNLNKISNGKSLFDIFIHNFQYKYNFIEKNLILVWINYDYDEIAENSSELFNVFDLFIKIPLINKVERETILRNFSERNPKIVFDINAIVNYTENWEVKDINQLLKVAIFKQFINTDINNVSNEITDVLINLIESGEYIPLKTYKPLKDQKIKESMPNSRVKIDQTLQLDEAPEEYIKERNELINQIQKESVSEFMLNQLYENAASKNYNELILIIDKLYKKEPLQDNDRKLLAKYPFILNDSPNMAQIYLEKAKKRVDLMKKAFGK